jgi:leader peptidase (prepilin peptidase)/N-methyltransferase
MAAWLLMTGAGVVLAGIDVSVHRLPRPVLAVTAAAIGPLVVVAGLYDRDVGLLLRAALSGAAFAVVYLILAFAGSGWVGLGDVYLAAILGLLLGTGPVSGVLVGALTPYLLATPILAARVAFRHLTRGSRVAWGPYLIAGSVLARIFIPWTT